MAVSADHNQLRQALAELRSRAPAAPVVHESLRTRSLCFDALDVQTSMRKSDPFALDLAYTRAMMAFQLFQPHPEHILLVGLGGGSLSKYCYRQFPEARITTVEIDARVIALRERFHIPPDSARFRVVHADAADYLAGFANGSDAADVILLDGFDAFGLPENLSSQSFYDACHAALREDGVLVANLLDHDTRVAIYLDRLRLACGGQLLYTTARREGNVIALGLKQRRLPGWAELQARARIVDAATGLELSLHVRRMERGQRAAADEEDGASRRHG